MMEQCSHHLLLLLCVVEGEHTPFIAMRFQCQLPLFIFRMNMNSNTVFTWTTGFSLNLNGNVEDIKFLGDGLDFI